MALRVFLVDDHEVVRVGISALIDAEEDMEVVGESGTVSDTLSRIEISKPDVALLDVRLPDGSGVELCRDIRSNFPDVACVMLTSHSDDEALFSSILAGASGYLLKGVRVEELIQAIRKVANGMSLLDSSITNRVLERLRSPATDNEPVSRLSKQEKRILELITDGKTNREIADAMFLAEKTVKNYVSNLLAKLGMSHRSEAAAYGARLIERKGSL